MNVTNTGPNNSIAAQLSQIKVDTRLSPCPSYRVKAVFALFSFTTVGALIANLSFNDNDTSKRVAATFGGMFFGSVLSTIPAVLLSHNYNDPDVCARERQDILKADDFMYLISRCLRNKENKKDLTTLIDKGIITLPEIQTLLLNTVNKEVDKTEAQKAVQFNFFKFFIENSSTIFPNTIQYPENEVLAKIKIVIDQFHSANTTKEIYAGLEIEFVSILSKAITPEQDNNEAILNDLSSDRKSSNELIQAS